MRLRDTRHDMLRRVKDLGATQQCASADGNLKTRYRQPDFAQSASIVKFDEVVQQVVDVGAFEVERNVQLAPYRVSPVSNGRRIGKRLVTMCPSAVVVVIHVRAHAGDVEGTRKQWMAADQASRCAYCECL